MTDQNNKTTTYAYDDADRLISVTDPANSTTYYAYKQAHEGKVMQGLRRERKQSHDGPVRTTSAPTIVPVRTEAPRGVLPSERIPLAVIN